jgi:hypothetical protein
VSSLPSLLLRFHFFRHRIVYPCSRVPPHAAPLPAVFVLALPPRSPPLPCSANAERARPRPSRPRTSGGHLPPRRFSEFAPFSSSSFPFFSGIALSTRAPASRLMPRRCRLCSSSRYPAQLAPAMLGECGARSAPSQLTSDLRRPVSRRCLESSIPVRVHLLFCIE